MARLPTSIPRGSVPHRTRGLYWFFLVSVVFQIYFSYRGGNLPLLKAPAQPKNAPESKAFWSPSHATVTDEDSDGNKIENENKIGNENENKIEIEKKEPNEPRKDKPKSNPVDDLKKITKFLEESRSEAISKIQVQPGRTKKDDNFLDNHLKIQERYLASKMEHVLDKAALERGKQTFVDLESDPRISEDPWFVFHIGPPKTATTTIQCGLEKYSLRLAKTDGYHYLGGGCGHEGKEYYMPNGEAGFLRLQVLTGLMNPGAGNLVPRFLERSNHLRETGRSVVYSSELMASRFGYKPSVMGGLQHALTEGAGFPLERIKIVLAYRHFVDWLPSYHYQLHASGYGEKKWNKKVQSKKKRRIIPFLQYAEQYLLKWENYQRMMANATGGITGPDIDVLRRRHEQEQEEKEEKEKQKQKEEDLGDGGDDNNDEDPEEEEDNRLLFGFLPEDRRSIHPSWWLYKLWSMYFPLPNQVQVYDMHSPMNSNRPNDDIVTNFVCNMLPHANKTCSKLMLLEDQRESEANDQPNKTAGAGDAAERSLVDSEEPSYDDPHLHPRESLLYVPKKEPDPNSARSKLMGNSTAAGGGSLQTRQSSDHHAAILVESMMFRGDIKSFDASEYGENYFSVTANPPEEGFDTFKGIVMIAQAFLDENGIRPPNEKYFDCLSKDLEDRLFEASTTFLDLIYKHTQMLTQAAEASTLSSSSSARTKEAIEKEKEKRYNQAKENHLRLFEKNKSKGKYCDINAEKISKEFPDYYAALSSMTHKTNFLHSKYRGLSPTAKEKLKIFKIDQATWDSGKEFQLRTLNWLSLTPVQKAAAYYLGWTPEKWTIEENEKEGKRKKQKERQRRKKKKGGK